MCRKAYKITLSCDGVSITTKLRAGKGDYHGLQKELTTLINWENVAKQLEEEREIKENIVKEHNELADMEPGKMSQIKNWDELLPHQKKFYEENYNV